MTAACVTGESRGDGDDGGTVEAPGNDDTSDGGGDAGQSSRSYHID